MVSFHAQYPCNVKLGWERKYQVSENFAPSAHKVTQLVIADTPFWGKEDGICFWKLNHMKM